MRSTWSQSTATAELNSESSVPFGWTPSNFASTLSPSRAAIPTQSRYSNRSHTLILSTIFGMGGNLSRSARIPAIWAGASRACRNNPWSPAQAIASTLTAINASISVGPWPASLAKR